MLCKKTHAFTLALSLAAIVLPAHAAPGREDLVIGQAAPLTGTIAGPGNEYLAGAAAYFAHVNDNGGIDGRKIRAQDDGYKPDQTLTLTRQPDKVVSYASMESFIAAKILVEAIRRSGVDPTQSNQPARKNEQLRRRWFPDELLAQDPRWLEIRGSHRDWP